MSASRLGLLDIRVYPTWLEPLRALGVPYVWGAGDLMNTGSWPNGAYTPLAKPPSIKGYDCSGFVLAVLANCSPPNRQRIDTKALFAAYGADMHTSSIADACDPVTRPEPGDIFYYKGHVMLVIGGPRMLLIGASGGGSGTFGKDPDAYVKVQRWDYRKDLITAMRFKPKYLLGYQEETR